MSLSPWYDRSSLGALALVALCWSGCSDSSADPCGSNADCADSYVCVGATADTDGVCSYVGSCVYDSECGTGLICNDSGACEPIGNGGGGEGSGNGGTDGTCATTAECAAGLECFVPAGGSLGVCVPGGGGSPCTSDLQCFGGYVCDGADGTCFAGCTEAAFECADGYQCDGADDSASVLGVCATIPATPYTMVIVTSEVSEVSDEVADTVTPGPDIDGIELQSGGNIVSAVVVSSQVGAAPENVTPNPNQAARRDAMSGIGPTFSCDLDGDAFFSMGSNTGFVAVSFGGGLEINSGDVISVYELSAGSCPNDVFSSYLDTYAVYIHDGAAPSTASQVRSSACLQARSAPEGGLTQVSVDTSQCD